MHKYLLLSLILLSAVAAHSQTMNPSDPVINYNSGAALGSASNPNQPAAGHIGDWIRTQNTGRIGWDDSKFKCYIYGSMAFRVRWPQNYDPTKKYPVVLFFHGGGEAHEIHDNEDQLFWGASQFQDMIVAGQYNAFLLFPQQDHIGWDNSYYTRINDVLDSMALYNGADPDRLITMGLSEGGLAAVAMASLYPKRVSTIVTSSPIDVTTIGNIPNYIHIPVWIGDGGTDNNPSAANAFAYADGFHAAGGDIFQTYSSLEGHVMWNTQWGMLDPLNNSILAQYWNASHKAQPLVYNQNTQFCAGKPIAAKMGVTAGFYAYQWQRGVGTSFSDIPGATANEYTATQAGSYRVHFMRTSTSGWSDWTPNPVDIITKPCSIDTLFAEHFEVNDDYQYNAPATEYKRYNFNCENGLFTSGTNAFTADATGTRGRRFSLNYTDACTYNATDRVWGMYNNQPTVKPNTNYLFSFYAGNQSTGVTKAGLVGNINGTTLTNLLTKPTTLPNSGANASWTKFTYLWNSGGATSADLAILNTVTTSSGNDFTLDEISFTKQLAPGGVASNMALWLKADNVALPDSSRLNDWANASGATPLTQLFQGNKPLLKNNSTDNINFNPLVSFNTANDQYMLGTNGYAGTGTYSAAHVFIVGRTPNNTQNDSVLIEKQSGSGSSNRVAVSLPNGGNVVWDAGSSTNSHMTTPFLAADVNKTLLWSFSKDNVNSTGSGNKQDIRKNGVVITSSNVNSPSFTGNSSNFKIGSSEERIAEVVYYLGANINAASQNRIESYLATKYGLTLGSTASPASYTASDGTTVYWPGSAIYQNDVFGVGLDSLSGLRQLQSNSVNSGSGDGTGQFGKANMILTATGALGDKDFLMMGNNADVLTEHTIIAGEAPAGVVNDKRIGREWKIRNTGNVGAVTLTFDTTGLTLAGGAVLGNFALLVDSDGDGDFTTGTASVIHATSSVGKQINFSGITLNDNVVITVITQINNSLPATWLGFTAEGVNGNAVLNWQTSEEINVDYYAVEHSTNGRDFTVLAVKPANNSLSVNNYTYTHQSISAGIHYYRIRRVDRDGVYKYSDVQTVKMSGVNSVQVRPNPVTGSTLTLSLSMQQKAQTSIQVLTLDGKVISKTNTQLVQGYNTVNINVDPIPTGIYLVQILLNDEVITKKFIRTR